MKAPTFIVGSICLVVDDGRVLLVRHSYRRRWGAPGGLLDRGEVPEATAIREVFEEVGLTVVPEMPPFAVFDVRLRRVDVAFRCNLAPGIDPADARPTSPEIDEVRWFPIDELPSMSSETTVAIRALGLLPPPERPDRPDRPGR